MIFSNPKVGEGADIISSADDFEPQLKLHGSVQLSYIYKYIKIEIDLLVKDET
jgi:hypothetical protein